MSVRNTDCNAKIDVEHRLEGIRFSFSVFVLMMNAELILIVNPHTAFRLVILPLQIPSFFYQYFSKCEYKKMSDVGVCSSYAIERRAASLLKRISAIQTTKSTHHESQ